MSNIKELKTKPEMERDAMLSFLDFMRQQVEDGLVTALVCLHDDGEAIQCEAIGVNDVLEAIGMLEVAKHTYMAETLTG